MTKTVKLCECGCGNPSLIAKRTDSLKGHIKGQPLRFINGHQGKENRWKTKRFCIRGHDTSIVGRNQSRECNACIKYKGRRENLSPEQIESRRRKGKKYLSSTKGYIKRREYKLNKSRALNEVKLNQILKEMKELENCQMNIS